MPLGLIRLIASSTLAVMAYTIAFPIVTLVLAQGRFGATAIGLMGLLPYALVLILSPWVARAVRVRGPRPAYTLGKALLLGAFLILATTTSYAAWIVAHVALGMGWALIWPLTESAVALLAPPGAKGQTTGIYQTVIGATFAIGPVCAAALTHWPRHVFWISAALAAVSWWMGAGLAWPHFGASGHPSREGRDRPLDVLGRTFRFLFALPVTWACAAGVGGLFENGLNMIAPANALALGYTPPSAARLAGVIGLGSLAAQVPLGAAADRFGALRTLACTLACLLASLAIFGLWSSRPSVVWLCAFVWGAAGGGLYTVAMGAAGHAFSETPRRMLETSVGLVFLYTVGCVLGPLVGGLSVDASPRFGLSGFFGAIVIFILFLIFPVLRVTLRLDRGGGARPMNPATGTVSESAHAVPIRSLGEPSDVPEPPPRFKATGNDPPH